jgi:hypothetical protein
MYQYQEALGKDVGRVEAGSADARCFPEKTLDCMDDLLHAI